MNLCQPDKENSCGSCCNIFHLKHASREKVCAFLSRRTKVWKKFKGNIQKYKKELEKVEEKDVLGLRRPCYFLGFIGKEKVGCLIHPQKIKKEIRGSFCLEQECIELSKFPKAESLIKLAMVCGDWYIYSAFMEFCVRHGQPFLKSKCLDWLVKHKDKIPKEALKDFLLQFCEEAVKHIQSCTSLACPGFDVEKLDEKFLAKWESWH